MRHILLHVLMNLLIQYQVNSNMMFMLYRLTLKQNLLKETTLDPLLLVIVTLNRISKVTLMFLIL